MSPIKTTAARKRAWVTRRKKYGQRGHRGSYWRGPVSSDPLRQRRQLAMLAAHCLTSGTLSLNEIACILGIDISEVLHLADSGRDELQWRASWA